MVKGDTEVTSGSVKDDIAVLSGADLDILLVARLTRSRPLASVSPES
jgi:hypothetical protein